MKYNITLDTESNSVIIKHEMDNKKYIKEVGTQDFINIVSGTQPKEKHFKPIISPLFIDNNDIKLLQWAKIGENREVHIFIKKASKSYLQIFETSYDMCGYPTLIFALTTLNKTLQSFRVTVVKDDNVNLNSKIYKYPFSNVSNNSFFVCTGRNNISYSLNTHDDFKKAINSFFYMPNTFEAFSQLSNSKRLDFRALADSLKGNDFPVELLVENGTYQKFLDEII